MRSLARFQSKALAHALRFPALRRLVYSTCSLYAEEDEHVVAAALAEYNASRGSEPAARLVPCLSHWPLRGSALQLSAEQAACCVRWDPQCNSSRGSSGSSLELGETGFFVALIEKGEGEGGQEPA